MPQRLDQNEIDAVLIEAAEALVEAGLRDRLAAWHAMFFKSLDYLQRHMPSRDFREELVRFSEMARCMADQIPDLG